MNGGAPALDAGEQARAFRRQLTFLVLEYLPDGLLVVDAGSGTIRMINDRAAALFGYAEEELVGQKVELLVPEDLREKHAELRAAYENDPKPVVRPPTPGRRKDGTTLQIEISLRSVITPDGVLAIASVREAKAETEGRPYAA